MPFLYHSRKYTLNEDFFSKWSATMAYVLGFWFADGYMRHDRSYSITFSSNDEQHLESIKKAVDSNIKLTPYFKGGEQQKGFTLYLRSKKLYLDLIALGGIRKKSLTMKFPFIPREFLADFIRGYFDGDGSVHFAKYLRTKDHRPQVDLRCNFTSGSPNFLSSLRDLLVQELDLFPRKLCSYGNGNQWKLAYGEKDSQRLLNFMYYKDCLLFLKRKAKYIRYKRENSYRWSLVG